MEKEFSAVSTEPVATMTIARGLSRTKVIRKQLEGLCDDIRSYGAWCDKSRHPLGVNGVSTVSVEKSLADASRSIQAKYQQFRDLQKEYLRIKTAIQRANLTTKVTIFGNVMSLYEARIMEKDMAAVTNSMVNSYRSSVANAQATVARYNDRFNNLSEIDRKAVVADVVYLLDNTAIDEMNAFNGRVVS